MSRHLQGSRAQCDTWKAAIDFDAGMPQRGVTFGGPDRTHPTIPGSGWTTTVTYEVLEANPGLAVLEVPDDQLTHLGRSGVPALAATKNDDELPTALLTLVRARRGQDADGNPLPFSAEEENSSSSKKARPA